MEQNIKSLYFIKSGVLILLTWLYYFCNEECTFNISKREHKYYVKLDIKNVRLLEECEGKNDSNFIESKEEITNDEEYDKKVTTNKRKGIKKTNIQSERSSLYKKEFDKQYKKQKKLIYRGKKLSHFERNFFKKLDYIDFIKKKPSISNKTYQKFVCKKIGHKIFLPTLVISWVLLVSLGAINYGFFIKEMKSQVDFIQFLVLLGISIVILMLWSVFTYMKFRKYKRIMKRKC
ncbi:Plasmodium exported protein, unknown function [Plasmodium malariae]|uniref:Uncharacterized protein n=1 Tax=Plasmodium malariae TaxID=5858 RepID=A0A1D3JHD9_PLAMA|nr:Plasmodium exported protein, unknown function [Plasmodium malariae]SBT85739.1 Plasmodium exported protein, unknown function [Plasmodium malariae]